MKNLLKSLAQRWNDWCGDKDNERAVRQHLRKQGFQGGTAQLKNFHLVAVQRPGWLQIYRFEVSTRTVGSHAGGADANSAKQSQEIIELYGLIRDDARKSLVEVRTFQDAQARRNLFRSWSKDLICLRGAKGLV